MHLLNYHESSDIVESFFCHEPLNLTNTCTAKKSDTIVEAPKSNRAESTNYDEIAMAAYRAGLLSKQRHHPTSGGSDSTNNNNDVIASRKEVREMLQDHLEGTLGYTEKTLPKICVPESTVDMIRNISLESEAALFPTFFESQNGREALLKDFESFKTTKLCSVDSETIRDHHPTISSRSL